MTKVSSDDLGTESIGKLLVKQAVPASIGILVMSLNVLVDSIFVGNWIGSIAIAAINVVLPVSFFLAALGMAIGIGGSSIISRALGAKNKPSQASKPAKTARGDKNASPGKEGAWQKKYDKAKPGQAQYDVRRAAKAAGVAIT